MNKKAFSLVELLISLIILSLIIAAFIPVMTKNKRSMVVVGAKEETNLTNDCKVFSSPEFVEGGLCENCGNCTLCDGKKYCITCEGKICSADNNESLDNKTCRCISCKNLSPNCTACTADTCTECDYGKYPSGKKCLDCPDPCTDCTSKDICTECKAGYYLVGDKCLPCPKGTYSEKGATSCIKCPMNTYSDKEGSEACTNCPSGKCSSEGSYSCRTCISNCTVYNESGCAQCADGYYSTTTQCLACGVKHCKTCSSNNTCTDCFASYHIDSQKPNYCWPNITTRNAGDLGGPTIPAGIQICNAGSSGTCNTSSGSIPTCWKGTTAAASCTILDGYSGCNRTVCNYKAAGLICAYNIKENKPMYLPTKEQWIALRDNRSANATYTGLASFGMCGSKSSTLFAMCSSAKSCPGARVNFCYPDYYWGDNAWLYINSTGILNGIYTSVTQDYAYSVRCAWD